MQKYLSWHQKAYLSSNSAGEPPHGFIRGVVFATTPHLKGKCHSISFNLQWNKKRTLGSQFANNLCVVLLVKIYIFFFYLDQVFRPSRP